MKELLEKIFPDKNTVKTITSLYLDSDPEEQLLIRASIARAAEDSTAILHQSGTDWVLCVVCKAEKPLHSTLRVFQTVAKQLVSEKWYFQGLTNLTEKECSVRPFPEIADDCLFGVSLFHEFLERKTNRTGAPSVQYYEKLGKFAFSSTGYEDIAEDWDFWVDFLQSEITL